MTGSSQADDSRRLDASAAAVLFFRFMFLFVSVKTSLATKIKRHFQN
jgi:hypothetical protein